MRLPRTSKYLDKKVIKNEIIEPINGEIWADCVGYEGIYKVSNFGRIISLERIIVVNGGKCGGSFRKGLKLMKYKVGTTGYYTLNLCKNGIPKDTLVHRIVAMAFIKNDNNYPYINHKNFNRIDNRVENLEWCTQKMNIHHAIDAGKIPICYGENTSSNKLTEKEVLEILKASGPFNEIAKKYGISRGNVGYIKTGKSWGALTGVIYSRKKKFVKRRK